MNSDMQNTGQSHSFYENLKWSHGQYKHFAPDDSWWNHKKRSVFDKSVEIHFFQKSGTHFRDKIRRFDVVSAAISMNLWSGLDQNGPRDSEIYKNQILDRKSIKSKENT